MLSKMMRPVALAGAMAQCLVALPYATPAHAQGWHDHRPGWQQERHGRDWRDRRDRERQRRDDARDAKVVAGVVGVAVLAGVIAAAANRGGDDRARARADYCGQRYGNYDPASDSYRAANGLQYRCE